MERVSSIPERRAWNAGDVRKRCLSVAGVPVPTLPIRLAFKLQASRPRADCSETPRPTPGARAHMAHFSPFPGRAMGRNAYAATSCRGVNPATLSTAPPMPKLVNAARTVSAT